MVKMEVVIEEQGYMVLFKHLNSIYNVACILCHKNHNNLNIYLNRDYNRNEHCHLNSVYNNPGDSSADRNNNNDHHSDHYRNPDNDR